MTKEAIKAEIAKLEAAQNLANAALSMYGAIKATELKQPRLVLSSLPAVEAAIEAWSNAVEADSMPVSEDTRC